MKTSPTVESSSHKDVLNQLGMPLYRAAMVRAHEGHAAESVGLSMFTLMERAGASLLQHLRSRWPTAQQVLVLCGKGNNGGDGYVLARLAREAKLNATVVQAGDAASITGDAARAREAFLGGGGEEQAWDAALLQQADVVVDALLGTGLSGSVTGVYAELIDALNRSGVGVLAADIPSGLCADTGTVLGVAVRACATVTFVARKPGLFTGAAADYVGDLQLNALGIGDAFERLCAADAVWLRRGYLMHWLPARRSSAHKGEHGRVLIVGGHASMPGACRIAGEGALRSGAGLVAVATAPGNRAVVMAAQPELMCEEIALASSLAPRLSWASVAVVGPGLGLDDWSRTLWHAVLAGSAPLVVDADALNLLAEQPVKRENWVLTPHPGEAARLLGCDIATVEQNRYAAVRSLQQKYGGVVVLKGAGTLICDGQTTAVANVGNPGMASGGMGDLLSGILGALIAQCLSPMQAACLAVTVHGDAGDLAAAYGERGMLATDLLPHVRMLVNAM